MSKCSLVKTHPAGYCCEDLVLHLTPAPPPAPSCSIPREEATEQSVNLTCFVPPFRLHEPEKSSEATTQVCCFNAGTRGGRAAGEAPAAGVEGGGSCMKHLSPVEGGGSPVKHLNVSTLWLEREEKLPQGWGSHFPAPFLPSPSLLLLLLLLPGKSGFVLPGEPAVR